MRILALITASGAGNATPFAAGLAGLHVDAVATAHLLNFFGDGLKRAHQSLVSGRVNLPLWDFNCLNKI
jgi:imidazole glycerol-phosphate synthase subunit HisF